MKLNTSLQKVTYAVISIIGIGWLMYIGKLIILPLVFAIILSVLLYPIDKKIKQFVKYQWLSILCTFLAVIIPILFIGALLSMQLIDIMDSLPSIAERLKLGASQLEEYVQQWLPFFSETSSPVISDPVHGVLDHSLEFFSQGLVSTTTLIGNFFITIIYIFFILFYRSSFKNFIIYQFTQGNRSDVRIVIESIKDTIQAYLGGLFIVIILLSVVNSIGLKIIGIEYPLFWGVLAGLLAIIPYLGTAIGGLLPLLYALSTTDNLWQPLAIVAFYGMVQFLEGNIITPKIVGDKININPLFAIISLIFFGSLWGMGGVILALPMVSILRIILSHFDNTKQLAVLMSTDISESADRFAEMSNK